MSSDIDLKKGFSYRGTGAGAEWEPGKKKKKGEKSGKQERGANQYLIFQVNFFPNVAQPPEVLQWASSFCSVSKCDSCRALQLRRRPSHHQLLPTTQASSAAESINWQSGGKVINQPTGRRIPSVWSVKSRKIRHNWNKLHRFDSSSVSVNRLPEQSHLWFNLWTF